MSKREQVEELANDKKKLVKLQEELKNKKDYEIIKDYEENQIGTTHDYWYAKGINQGLENAIAVIQKEVNRIMDKMFKIGFSVE